VHEWRKSLRRARALLRLARPAVDDPVRRSVNASLRTAQRAASSLRDAEALQLALRALRKQKGQTAAERRDITTFSRSLRRAAPPAAKATSTLQAHRPRILAAAGRFERALPPEMDWPEIEKGLRDSYVRAREALRRLRHDEADQQFHDLRKAIKSLHYQTGLLASTGHRPAAKLRKRLDELAETQGHVTDLLLLRAHAPDLPALKSLIARTIPPNRKASIKLARRVLHGAPKGFAKKLIPK
jgi:CHAD domain-containing protein